MEFSWLTVEVRVSIDLLRLGQKHHLAPSNASKPPAAKLPPARRGISQSEEDEPEDKLALFFSPLAFVSNLLEHDKGGLTLCEGLLQWQVLPSFLVPGHSGCVCPGEETQLWCHRNEE